MSYVSFLNHCTSGIVSAAPGLAMRFLSKHTKHTVLIIHLSTAVIFISAWACCCSGKKALYTIGTCYFIVIHFESCETSITPELALHGDVMAASKRDQTNHVVIIAQPLTMHLTEEY